MAPTFSVTIISPAGPVYSGRASSIVVPAELGYMGMLAHHAPIVACLRPGTITVKDGDGEAATFPSTGNGFIEFSDNAATLLLET